VTDHRDPIEAWLSADVEPLPPRPGTFERVRRRARRRKAARTISAAAGAAVIVAAAATVPQVARSLQPSPPSGPNKLATGTTGKSSGAISPKPTPSSQLDLRRGLPLSSAGSGPQPPANFEPTSVTFVGSHTGAVLGQGGTACAKGLCTAVAGTANYGRDWSAMAAPATEAPNGSSGVSQIRFLDLRDGWAFGPALFATHDGGATWTPIATLPGRVIDLAAVGNRVLAVAASCSGQGRAFASGCTSFALYSAKAGSDQWQPVPGAFGTGSVRPGALQLTPSGGYLLADHRIYAGPVKRGSWHIVTAGSGSEPPCLRATSHDLAVIAPSGSGLYLACGMRPADAQPGGTGGTGGVTLYLSADAGRSWQPRSTPKAQGTTTSLAVSPDGVVVLATTTGIWWSPDAITWHQARVTVAAPAGGFIFVGMTTSKQGVAVPADWALHELFITRDGGRDWQPSRIPR